MKKSNYNLVLEIIKSYERENILNDFKNEFKEGKNVLKKDYFRFCEKYIGDCSEYYYIKLNWKYIRKGGDENVYDECY
jgi:hypothetical protein